MMLNNLLMLTALIAHKIVIVMVKSKPVAAGLVLWWGLVFHYVTIYYKSNSKMANTD